MLLFKMDNRDLQLQIQIILFELGRLLAYVNAIADAIRDLRDRVEQLARNARPP